jgi:hypothetical protein
MTYRFISIEHMKLSMANVKVLRIQSAAYCKNSKKF